MQECGHRPGAPACNASDSVGRRPAPSPAPIPAAAPALPATSVATLAGAPATNVQLRVSHWLPWQPGTSPARGDGFVGRRCTRAGRGGRARRGPGRGHSVQHWTTLYRSIPYSLSNLTFEFNLHPECVLDLEITYQVVPWNSLPVPYSYSVDQARSAVHAAWQARHRVGAPRQPQKPHGGAPRCTVPHASAQQRCQPCTVHPPGGWADWQPAPPWLAAGLLRCELHPCELHPRGYRWQTRIRTK